MAIKQKLTKYANALYQNAMVGKQSISDLMEKTEDVDLSIELKKEYDLYDSVCDSIEQFAKQNKIIIDDNNFLEKTKMWISINMTTMFDKSTRHIIEMLLLGTTMGLSTCYKDQFDHSNISDELDNIAKNLEQIMEKNFNNLKNLLKCCKQ